MDYLISIAIGAIVWWIIWKIIGPRVKLPKEVVWGLSAAIAIVIPSLYIEYALNLLADPFMYFATAAVAALLFYSNTTYYKEYNKDKKTRKICSSKD